MSRLIDADKLMDIVCENCVGRGVGLDDKIKPTINDCRKFHCNAMEIIGNAPTVDVVEVVRCKDCIYHNSKSHNCGHPKMGFGLMNVNENDFCPHGERRTE